MANHLNSKVDEMSYDNLIAGMTPPVKVASGTISKLSVAASYARGTVLAKSSSDGKLYILGSAAAGGDTLTPDCILCDPEEIGTTEDVAAAVYVAGCFNVNALIVAEGYTITEADRDKLRERGLYLAQLWD